jgi:hypothetical protein
MAWKSTSLREETLETVEQRQENGESIDECIARVFAEHKGRSDDGGRSGETRGETAEDFADRLKAIDAELNEQTETLARLRDEVGNVPERTADDLEQRVR